MTVLTHLKVQMRTGGPPGLTDSANRVAGANSRTPANPDLIQMGISRVQPTPMMDRNEVSITAPFSGDRYPTAAGSTNNRAKARTNVNATMKSAPAVNRVDPTPIRRTQPTQHRHRGQRRARMHPCTCVVARRDRRSEGECKKQRTDQVLRLSPVTAFAIITNLPLYCRSI